MTKPNNLGVWVAVAIMAVTMAGSVVGFIGKIVVNRITDNHEEIHANDKDIAVLQSEIEKLKGTR